jgi:hypothetical protein
MDSLGLFSEEIAVEKERKRHGRLECIDAIAQKNARY